VEEFGGCGKIFPTDGLVEFFNAWFEGREVTCVMATGQEVEEGEEAEERREREGAIFHYM